MSSSGIAVRRTASLPLAYDRTIQYAAGLSVLLLASLEYWIPAFVGMTTENVARVRILQTQLRVPAARCARVVNESFRPWEGVGNAGCPLHPRSRVHLVVVERTRVATSTPESPGIPARNGFNGFLRALPGDRAFLSPSSADNSADLTPASGRQDHTTSQSASSALVFSAAASTASRLRP